MLPKVTRNIKWSKPTLEDPWVSLGWASPQNVVFFPSVLWHCWLGDRKGIRPVKCCLLVLMIWLELCVSYSSSCHHSPPPSPLASVKSRMETFCTSLPACPGCSGKWLLNERCHWLLVALLMKSLPVPLHTLNPFLYLYIPVKSWHYQSKNIFPWDVFWDVE